MKLTVSLAQMEVVVANPDENLKKAESCIKEAVARKSDIVCFPEMWTTGFNWKKNEKVAAGQQKVIDQVAALAKQYDIWINGSMLALNEDKKVSNASFLFNNKGKIAASYRKTHLFSLLHENDHMAPGKSLTVMDTPWGRAGLAICYDIRFPELFRTYALQGVEMVFSPMAFPHPRLEHWKILVRARAIENQMFIIGTNRVGTEDFGQDGAVTYFGTSCIIDPWGKTVIEANETDEVVLTATIDLSLVSELRSKMTVLKDRRPDLYEL